MCAKIAEDEVYVNMAGTKKPAKTVEGMGFANMGKGKPDARIAEGAPSACVGDIKHTARIAEVAVSVIMGRSRRFAGRGVEVLLIACVENKSLIAKEAAGELRSARSGKTSAIAKKAVEVLRFAITDVGSVFVRNLDVVARSTAFMVRTNIIVKILLVVELRFVSTENAGPDAKKVAEVLLFASTGS